MRIILLSDLHINPGNDQNDVSWVKHFCNFMNSNYCSDTLIFVLGDIVDKGSINREAAYDAADRIFSYIESRLSSVHYQIAFLPGNHDYCDNNLNAFMQFCKRHQTFGTVIFDFLQRNTWNFWYENFNFIFVDSIQDGNHALPGSIDITNACDCVLPDKTNVLLMHHSLLFEDAYNHTGIINQPETVDFISRHNIGFVFHGHSHATRGFQIGGHCLQYGIGSIGTGLSGLLNEDEQFLELQTNGHSIEGIAKWQWHGGAAKYEMCLLYPDTVKHYESGELIPRIKYDVLENYIERYVMPRDLASADELTRYFSEGKKTTLFEVCQKDRLVLFIADAGLGKTVEMKNLAYVISEKNPYMRPIFLSLGLYGNEPLQEYINMFVPEYKTLDSEQFLLIMDGYDELAHPEEFKRALSQYMIKNCNTHICISMRSNFLLSNSSAFKKFSVYQLLELESADIKNELQKTGVNEKAFHDECYRKNLLNLLRNPFYLRQLIIIFLSDNSLPSQLELMDRLIEEQLSQDTAKFEYALRIPLEDCRYEAERALTRLAYGMQLLNCTFCNEKTYQYIIEEKDRQYIKCSSLTINTPHGHGFSHSIFKEHLIAKYVCKLDPADIIVHISISGTNYLNPNWFNILGFISQSNPCAELINWLLDAEPLALTKLESDRVSAELRYSILTATLLDIVNKNIWFRNEVCSEKHLAVFSQSPQAVDLLISHITTPAHFRSLYFCLSVLTCFSNLYGADDRVRHVLINCYQSNNVRAHEKQVAISAIAVLHLNTPEITEDLVERFAASQSSYERLGVYEYLLQTNQTNQYVDFLLSGMKNISYLHDNNEVSNGTENFILIECLNSVVEPMAIERVISWYSHKDNMSIDFYERKKLFANFFDKASKEYDKGNVSLFETVYIFLVKATRQYSHYHIYEALKFFSSTGTIEIAFERLLSKDVEDSLFIVAEIIQFQSDLIDVFCNLYSEDKLQDPNMLKQYALRYHRADEIFQKCVDAIQVKTGETLEPPAPPIDYQLQLRKDTQTFFECLFDSNAIQGLLNKLAALYDNQDITCEQLRDTRICYENYPTGTRMMEITLIQSGFKKERIVDFIDLVDWDIFFIDRICYLFNRENEATSLIINDKQHGVLSKVYHQLEENLNYHTAVEESQINSLRFSRDIHNYMILKEALSLPSPDSYYLGLLEIPCLFVNKKSNIGEKYDLIEQHVASCVIAKQIAILIPLETRIYVLNDLMFGCKRYRIESCKDDAVRVCRMRTISAYNRRNALEYLLDVFGSELILNEIMPAADEDLFELIIDFLRAAGDDQLKAEMISRYRKSPSRFLLKNLIAMNVPEGLQTYIDTSRKVGGIMDFANNIGEITEAISMIHDISLLPLLLDAVRLRFFDSFKDGSFHTLYSSLQNALSACAKNNFNLVWRSVDELKAELQANLEAVSFCNMLQSNIIESNKMLLIKELSVQEVREILRKVE